MTKAEYIERYGMEWYEPYLTRNKFKQKVRYQNDPEYREHVSKHNKARWRNEPELCKARCRDYLKKRYHNDSEYRESEKARNRARKKARYVEDGRIDLIENYEFALADDFKDWDIHHRLEIHDDYINSVEHLKLMNLYYNRPPTELIWLKKSEHIGMHRKGKARAQ